MPLKTTSCPTSTHSKESISKSSSKLSPPFLAVADFAQTCIQNLSAVMRMPWRVDWSPLRRSLGLRRGRRSSDGGGGSEMPGRYLSQAEQYARSLVYATIMRSKAKFSAAARYRLGRDGEEDEDEDDEEEILEGVDEIGEEAEALSGTGPGGQAKTPKRSRSMRVRLRKSLKSLRDPIAEFFVLGRGERAKPAPRRSSVAVDAPMTYISYGSLSASPLLFRRGSAAWTPESSPLKHANGFCSSLKDISEDGEQESAASVQILPKSPKKRKVCLVCDDPDFEEESQAKRSASWKSNVEEEQSHSDVNHNLKIPIQDEADQGLNFWIQETEALPDHFPRRSKEKEALDQMSMCREGPEHQILRKGNFQSQGRCSMTLEQRDVSHQIKGHVIKLDLMQEQEILQVEEILVLEQDSQSLEQEMNRRNLEMNEKNKIAVESVETESSRDEAAHKLTWSQNVQKPEAEQISQHPQVAQDIQRSDVKPITQHLEGEQICQATQVDESVLCERLEPDVQLPPVDQNVLQPQVEKHHAIHPSQEKHTLLRPQVDLIDYQSQLDQVIDLPRPEQDGQCEQVAHAIQCSQIELIIQCSPKDQNDELQNMEQSVEHTPAKQIQPLQIEQVPQRSKVEQVAQHPHVEQEISQSQVEQVQSSQLDTHAKNYQVEQFIELPVVEQPEQHRQVEQRPAVEQLLQHARVEQITQEAVIHHPEEAVLLQEPKSFSVEESLLRAPVRVLRRAQKRAKAPEEEKGSPLRAPFKVLLGSPQKKKKRAERDREEESKKEGQEEREKEARKEEGKEEEKEEIAKKDDCAEAQNDVLRCKQETFNSPVKHTRILANQGKEPRWVLANHFSGRIRVGGVRKR